ncbi:TetR family transcriptional regulator [Streptomyces sp. SS7]|uniref:TetR/AcrR family transcriptional regulator n=1 Tax=Streptomyces sp. SS7 TaxID=3108485 RepID=UPI0030EC92CC
MADRDRAKTGGDTCGAGYHAQIKAGNRARIIRAARDLFLAQEYDKTSLAQIAGEARLSTGTLFSRSPPRLRCSRPSPPSSGSWMCSTLSRLRPAVPGTA